MQMEYMLMLHPRDRERIETLVKEFEQYSPEQLVEHYNRQAALGIVGSFGQAISLAAFALVCRRVFGESPVYAKGGVIALQGKVQMRDGKLLYLEPEKLKV